jgi:hypothetical protein
VRVVFFARQVADNSGGIVATVIDVCRKNALSHASIGTSCLTGRSSGPLRCELELTAASDCSSFQETR